MSGECDLATDSTVCRTCETRYNELRFKIWQHQFILYFIAATTTVSLVSQVIYGR